MPRPKQGCDWYFPEAIMAGEEWARDGLSYLFHNNLTNVLVCGFGGRMEGGGDY